MTDEPCPCDSCQNAREWVNAPLEVVVDTALAALTAPQEGDANDRRFLIDLIREHDLAADENTSPADYRAGLALGILASGFARAAAPAETEWAVQVAGMNSTDPMFFEFPDRQSAERFIKNGALWYTPRPNGDPKALVSRRKASVWLPVPGGEGEGDE